MRGTAPRGGHQWWREHYPEQWCFRPEYPSQHDQTALEAGWRRRGLEPPSYVETDRRHDQLEVQVTIVDRGRSVDRGSRQRWRDVLRS